jgi:hypothetical protein
MRCLAIALAAAAVARADNTVPSPGPRPIIRAVLNGGSDPSAHMALCHPDFVLYDDRHAIFLEHDGGRERYFKARLEPAEYAELLAFFADDSFLSLGSFGPPETRWVACDPHIDVRTGSEWRSVSTIGEALATAPPAFAQRYQRIIHFNHAHAEPWEPATMHVTLSRIPLPPRKVATVPWPAFFPSGTTARHPWYVTFALGIEHLADMERLQRDLAGRLIESDGDLYALSGFYRDDPS